MNEHIQRITNYIITEGTYLPLIKDAESRQYESMSAEQLLTFTNLVNIYSSLFVNQDDEDSFSYTSAERDLMQCMDKSDLLNLKLYIQNSFSQQLTKETKIDPVLRQSAISTFNEYILKHGANYISIDFDGYRDYDEILDLVLRQVSKDIMSSLGLSESHLESAITTILFSCIHNEVNHDHLLTTLPLYVSEKDLDQQTIQSIICIGNAKREQILDIVNTKSQICETAKYRHIDEIISTICSKTGILDNEINRKLITRAFMSMYYSDEAERYSNCESYLNQLQLNGKQKCLDNDNVYFIIDTLLIHTKVLKSKNIVSNPIDTQVNFVFDDVKARITMDEVHIDQINNDFLVSLLLPEMFFLEGNKRPLEIVIQFINMSHNLHNTNTQDILKGIYRGFRSIFENYKTENIDFLVKLTLKVCQHVDSLY